MDIWLLYKSKWILKLVVIFVGMYMQSELMWII